MTDGSLWAATVARSGAHPALAGDVTVDVAVVGGGIVGLTTACLAAGRGVRVALLEQGRVGDGTTGRTTGKVQEEHGGKYASLRHRHGRSGARAYATANRRGIDVLDALVAEGEVDAGYLSVDAHLVAPDAAQVATVEEEAAAMRDAGLAPQLHDAAPELPFATARTLTLADQRELHPRALVQELARVAAARGAAVHEHTPVEGLRRRKPGWILRTPTGQVRARHVVLATRLPLRDRALTFARSEPTGADALGVRLEDGPLLGSYYLLGRDRTVSLRGSRWPAGEDDHLVAISPSSPTGDRRSNDELVAWVRERFAVADEVRTWRAWDQEPFDDRPLIGPAGPGGVLTATGFGKWGLALGAFAAEVLVDHVVGTDRPDAAFFRTTRVTPLGTGALRTLQGNAQIGVRFVGDRVRAGRLDPGGLTPGEGTVGRVGTTPVAACRDADGQLHAVSAVCTHLGCLVEWDGVQGNWGCPCHASRFAPDGTVLEGPATRPLDPVELPET